VELFSVPWEWVPERVSGTWTADIAPMLTGLPNDEPPALYEIPKTDPLILRESKS
jgi:hypothetical protein